MQPIENQLKQARRAKAELEEAVISNLAEGHFFVGQPKLIYEAMSHEQRNKSRALDGAIAELERYDRMFS